MCTYVSIEMGSWLRVLLWTAVVVAPGGVLLLPFLAAGELRRREQSKP
jgi:hypothetical protein